MLFWKHVLKVFVSFFVFLFFAFESGQVRQWKWKGKPLSRHLERDKSSPQFRCKPLNLRKQVCCLRYAKCRQKFNATIHAIIAWCTYKYFVFQMTSWKRRQTMLFLRSWDCKCEAKLYSCFIFFLWKKWINLNVFDFSKFYFKICFCFFF